MSGEKPIVVTAGMIRQAVNIVLAHTYSRDSANKVANEIISVLAAICKRRECEATVKAGRLISLYRKKKGLTQVDVARITSLPQPHISNIENGRHRPSQRTLEKLATALSIKVSDLL